MSLCPTCTPRCSSSGPPSPALGSTRYHPRTPPHSTTGPLCASSHGQIVLVWQPNRLLPIPFPTWPCLPRHLLLEDVDKRNCEPVKLTTDVAPPVPLGCLQPSDVRAVPPRWLSPVPAAELRADRQGVHDDALARLLVHVRQVGCVHIPTTTTRHHNPPPQPTPQSSHPHTIGPSSGVRALIYHHSLQPAH